MLNTMALDLTQDDPTDEAARCVGPTSFHSQNVYHGI